MWRKNGTLIFGKAYDIFFQNQVSFCFYQTKYTKLQMSLHYLTNLTLLICIIVYALLYVKISIVAPQIMSLEICLQLPPVLVWHLQSLMSWYCLFQEHKQHLLGRHSWSWLYTPGTCYHLTLDLVILYTLLKTPQNTPVQTVLIWSQIPLYQTLSCYTNTVLLLLGCIAVVLCM